MKRPKPLYAAIVEANRRAQIEVLESVGRKVPEILRDPVRWYEHLKREQS